MSSWRLRDIRSSDSQAITDIYGYWVLHGTGTFEETPPPLAEMSNRIAAIAKSGMPWIVAEDESGSVVGYAYASPFRPRIGYRYAVEDSIYVAPQAKEKGLGGELLATLIARVQALGVRQMIAVIGDSNNRGSIALHAAAGFTYAGVLKNSGFKFSRWLDVVLMQRALGEGGTTQPNSGEGWNIP